MGEKFEKKEEIFANNVACYICFEKGNALK